ncbi:MAG: hypothetical protein ACNA8R_07985 [Nitriliruptoraceae bacterium]
MSSDDGIEAQRHTQLLIDDTPRAPAGPPAWLLPTVAVAVMLALVASLALGIVQWRLATEARAERDALATEVALLRAEVEDLRGQVDGQGFPGDGFPSLDPEQLLDDLLSGLLEGSREGAAELAERLQRWFAERGGAG